MDSGRALITRNCIVCQKALVGAIGGNAIQEFVEPPSGAIVFVATGNYGSMVFDSFPDGYARFMEICVCDECVRSNKNYVLCGSRQQTQLYTRIHKLSEKE